MGRGFFLEVQRGLLSLVLVASLSCGLRGGESADGGAGSSGHAGAGGHTGTGGQTATGGHAGGGSGATGSGGASSGAGGNAGAGGGGAGSGGQGAGGGGAGGAAGAGGNAGTGGAAACSSTQHTCAGTCVDNDSVQNCGSRCNSPCTAPSGGTATCSSGSCDFACNAATPKKCPTSMTCIAATGCCDNSDCPTLTTGQTGTCDSGTNTCNYSCPATAPQSCTLNGTTTCIASGGCCKDTDCSGSCMACDTSSHTCVAAKSEADPTGRCAGTCDASGACKSKLGQTCTTTTGGCVSGTTCSADNYCCGTACGGNGTCAGSCSTGTCVFPTTTCAGNSCSGSSVIGPSTCSGGTCKAPAAVPCGARQTCTGAVGSATCTCKVDPVCSAVGNTCASTSTLAACAQDAQACFYESSSMMCTNGACSGTTGAASCCTNACTSGATQCLSGSSLQTCGVGTNGCTALTTSTCSTGLVCERYAPAACLDPNWAEWPMPNDHVDVTAGAPNLEAYTDNGDGTVTDKVTGLMWQQATSDAAQYQFNWTNAVAHCPMLTLAGHTDWRLPTLIELLSIVDDSLSAPAINGTYFPSTPAEFFWTATPAAGQPGEAWYIDFDYGNVYFDFTSTTGDVRCVR